MHGDAAVQAPRGRDDEQGPARSRRDARGSETLMPELFTALQAFGLPGLCIAGLVWYVLRRETAYEARITALQAELKDALTKRGDDGQRLAADALKLGDVLEEQTRALADLRSDLKERLK